MRRRWLAIAAVVGLAVVAALLAFGPSRAGGRITGRVVGPVGSSTLVLLIDPAVGARATVAADGAFEAVVPAGGTEPWIVVDSQRGPYVQTLHPIDPARGDDVGALALWDAAAQVRAQGPRVRFDWSPIPQGEGYPRRPRYSVLICYTRRDGQEGEATFPSDEAWIEMTDAAEELLPFLNERDPARPEVEVRVRAFDVDDPRAPMWVGARLRWRLDTGQARPWEPPPPR